MTTVPSPCVGLCTLDPDGTLCCGCLRTLDEIAGWAAMSDAERRAVLKVVEDRAAQRAAESGRGNSADVRPANR